MRFQVPLVLGVILLLSGTSLAGDAEITAVTAIGVGATPEAAQKDALINAVQQAVGMYIQGDTYVKNADLIHEQILSASNGFVQEFTVTIPAHKRATDGLYQITIRANVKKGEVAERLRRANLAAAEVKGAAAWAQAFTKARNAEEAAKLLDDYFDDLAVSLLRPQILVAADGGVEPQTAIDRGTQRLWCAWSIEVSFDRDLYYKEVRPAIEHILATMAVRPKERTFMTKSAYSVPATPNTLGFTGAPVRNLAGSKSRIRWLPDSRSLSRRPDFDEPRKGEIAVVVDVSQRNGLLQENAVYYLPERYQPLLERRLTGACLDVRLLDADGELIESGVVDIDRTALALIGGRNDRTIISHVPFECAWYDVPTMVFMQQLERHPKNIFFMSPQFALTSVGRDGDGSTGFYMDAAADSVVVRYEAALDEMSVKRITKLEVEVIQARQ